MIAALLLAVRTRRRPPSTPSVAFARDAKRIGQWTAFRKWADRDAVMFTPQAVWARNFLKVAEGPAQGRSAGARRRASSRATAAPR